MRNFKWNNFIMHGLWRSFQVRKKWKLKEVKDFTVKLRVFVFKYKFLKKLHKNYSKFVWPTGNVINVIQSFSFQLYEIIIYYLYLEAVTQRCS